MLTCASVLIKGISSSVTKVELPPLARRDSHLRNLLNNRREGGEHKEITKDYLPKLLSCSYSAYRKLDPITILLHKPLMGQIPFVS